MSLQDQHRTVMFVADLHAITEKHDPRKLAEDTLSTAAVYIACGIDVSRTTLFIQSHVHEHAGLARLLGAVSSVNMLRGMIQFKEKSVRQGEDVRLGLLDYPVLMAADILLYNPDLVPVGNDQHQHLQLTAKLASKFNATYGDVFKVPQPVFVPEAARIMSLTNGSCKMSKSDPDDNSRINLLDKPDQIRAKIKKAKTDAIFGVEFDNPERPEVHNLLTIYRAVTGKSREEILQECQGKGFGFFKPLLTDALIAALNPIRERHDELMGDKASLMALLRTGRDRAREVASRTYQRAAQAMGFALDG